MVIKPQKMLIYRNEKQKNLSQPSEEFDLMLTCAKPVQDSTFELVTPTKTIRFQIPEKSTSSASDWVQAINLANTQITQKFLQKEQNLHKPASSGSPARCPENRKNIKRLVEKLKFQNQVCVDCGRSAPSWVSVNLGVVVCIECSGQHRQLGADISRIKSLNLDNFTTFELLLPFSVGNERFNQEFGAIAGLDITEKYSAVDAQYEILFFFYFAFYLKKFTNLVFYRTV